MLKLGSKSSIRSHRRPSVVPHFALRAAAESEHRFNCECLREQRTSGGHAEVRMSVEQLEQT